MIKDTFLAFENAMSVHAGDLCSSSPLTFRALWRRRMSGMQMASFSTSRILFPRIKRGRHGGGFLKPLQRLGARAHLFWSA